MPISTSSLSQASGDTLGILASGTSRARVWVDGLDRSRVALLQPLEETDLVRNGSRTWVWHSVGSRAARVDVVDVPVLGVLTAMATGSPVEPPDEIARRLLALRDGSTLLSLASPDWVAGRRAYELVMTPLSSATLVARLSIAVDVQTGLALRARVFAHGRSSPVIDARFTSISFSRPAPSNFTFHAPPEPEVSQAPTLSAAWSDVTVGRRGERDRFDRGAGPDVSGAVRLAERLGRGWDEVLATRAVASWRLEGLLQVGSPISGKFGTGRQVQTPLFTVVLLDNGRLAVGTVSPARLHALLAATP